MGLGVGWGVKLGERFGRLCLQFSRAVRVGGGRTAPTISSSMSQEGIDHAALGLGGGPEHRAKQEAADRKATTPHGSVRERWYALAK